MTMTRNETAAEKRDRPFEPGEFRGHQVRDTSVEVGIQCTDTGTFVVMVKRAGVLDDEARTPTGTNEPLARMIARMYIAAAVAQRDGTTAGLDGRPRSPQALAPWPVSRVGC